MQERKGQMWPDTKYGLHDRLAWSTVHTRVHLPQVDYTWLPTKNMHHCRYFLHNIAAYTMSTKGLYDKNKATRNTKFLFLSLQFTYSDQTFHNGWGTLEGGKVQNENNSFW